MPFSSHFFQNHYQDPAQLFIIDKTGQETLKSEEGSTQGDPSAMAFYALGVKPLINTLGDLCSVEKLCRQAWFADDSSAIGILAQVKNWWLKLEDIGPKFGYYPKPSKSILILKDPALMQQASELFADTQIQITCSGQRHLGAVIGQEEYKQQYISTKVSKWVEDVTALADIANDEPQAALSAYTKSICHRWVFVQRTINNISNLFQPLEDCIREKFIPAVVGRPITDHERQIFSLPVRYGGFGIADPTETADREYDASRSVTEGLANQILHQHQDFALYDQEAVSSIIKHLQCAKDLYLTQKLEQIKRCTENPSLVRCLDLSREKGSGSWLTALPLKDHGFCLNKQEFRDAICLRYGWQIPNTPPYCGCGVKNSVDHTLICAKGGYVAMRHNALRDLNADFQSEVCKDVTLEQSLLPLNDEEVNGTAADRAAPDISSIGMWSTFERTFYDVRVLHPNAPSYMATPMPKLYERHEQEKMKKYSSRVITVERASFTPLVYTTFGGWGPQAQRYHKRLASLIASKRNEEYHHVINHIRLKVRFSLLKSVLIAVRGQRGKRHSPAQPFSSTAFNMVPEAMQYECF